MVKQITITISDYVWEAYIADFKGNRSELIEKFILLGAEAEINTQKNQKAELIQTKHDLLLAMKDRDKWKKKFEKERENKLEGETWDINHLPESY